MNVRLAGPSPTAREREVAQLIRLGLTNREIAQRLGISERTVDAHVQNILNKLGGSNRAQIAAWSATSSLQATPAAAAGSAPLRTPAPTASDPLAHGWSAAGRRSAPLAAALVLVGVLVPFDHGLVGRSTPPASNVQRGDLVYDSQFAADGHEFGLRYVIGQPSASSVEIINGGIEYSVLGAGGNTGNNIALPDLDRYYVEVELSVKPGSNVSFWLNLTSGRSPNDGQHLVDLETSIEAMQMAYFANTGDFEPLGPQVFIKGLQTGRKVTVGALVRPPAYSVYLDGAKVIDLRHPPSVAGGSLSFSIFGDGLGTVRVSAIRVYLIG